MIMASGDVSNQGPWRVALLGKSGAGKSTVANKLRKDESSVKEGKGVMKFTVIDTPGWDKMSVDCTSDTIKQEIVKRVTEPPGSHALLFVLPVTAYGEVASEEVESHCQHIELLSEKAWRFTIILFSCQGEVQQSVIDRYLEATEKLLEKCDRRQFVLQKDTPISDLQQEIEDLVQGNNGGCLKREDYYWGLSHEITEVKKKSKETEEKLKETEEKLKETEEKLKETKEKLKETEQKLKETEEKLKETEEKLKETEQKSKTEEKSKDFVCETKRRRGSRDGLPPHFAESKKLIAMVCIAAAIAYAWLQPHWGEKET